MASPYQFLPISPNLIKFVMVILIQDIPYLLFHVLI